eukprot:g3971.t1
MVSVFVHHTGKCTLRRWSGPLFCTSHSRNNGVALPTSPIEMIFQAKHSIQEGLDRDMSLQQMQFLLPINEKQYNYLAIEAVDYPCSLFDEFQSCCSLTKAVLQQLLGEQELTEQRLDDGGVEGDPCSAIYPQSKELVAVVFPTSDQLKNLQRLVEDPERSVLIINPQWNDSGQVISDFGFGPWKKAAEEFLNKFDRTYFHKEQRIGSAGSVDPSSGRRYITGAVVRILLSSPDEYNVFAMSSEGSNQLIGSFDHQPGYQELEILLQEARKRNLKIFEVAKETSGPDGVTAGPPSGIQGQLEDLNDFIVDSLDASTLRQELTKRGLPTSGRIAKLKERLKAAIASEETKS